MMGVARLVSQEVFEEANRRYELHKRFNLFSVCGLECALRAQTHIRKLYSDNAPIDYIFDQGDEGQGMLTSAMRERGLPDPIFRHSKPAKDEPEIAPAVQLQCCDFVAWELRKARVTQDDPAFKRYRKSLEALKGLNTWKEYTHLEDFCRENNIKRRKEEAT
jgi:hypothetical protein